MHFLNVWGDFLVAHFTVTVDFLVALFTVKGEVVLPVEYSQFSISAVLSLCQVTK